MKAPRGYVITGWNREEGRVTCYFRLARWRLWLLRARVFWNLFKTVHFDIYVTFGKERK